MVLYENLNTVSKFLDYPEDTLGDKIRKIRNMKGYTAKELSKLCGISENSIYCYESDTAIPGKSTLKKIAKSLDVKIGYLKKIKK